MRKVISLLLSALRQHELIGAAVIPPFSVLLSGQAVYQVFLASGVTVYAKVTHPSNLAKEQGWMHLDLSTEYRGLTRAAKAFSSQVPTAICLHEEAQWQILMTKGIAHAPVANSMLCHPGDLLSADLYQFFSRSFEAFRFDSDVTHRSYLHDIATRYTHINGVADRLAWLQQPQSAWLDALPHVSQHGDFVVNNLGLADDRFIFFDWEDFDRVSLPGFDLSTAIISALDFDSNEIAAFFSGKRYPSLMHLVARVCKHYRMDLSDFAFMFPIYLAMFLELKRERSPARQAALIDMANDLPETLICVG